MCLVINKFKHPFNKPKIAKKDIICYKVLYYENGCYRTPYQWRYVGSIRDVINLEFSADTFQEKPHMQHGWNAKFIDYGIHTYSKICPSQYKYRYEHIFICIIPKGTKYWIGKDDDLVSEKIVFKERLKEYV